MQGLDKMIFFCSADVSHRGTPLVIQSRTLGPAAILFNACWLPAKWYERSLIFTVVVVVSSATTAIVESCQGITLEVVVMFCS
jgi:hypothetical protein